MKKKIILQLLMAATFSTHAADTKLSSMTDAQLVARWNSQADQYEKAFRMKGCKTTNTPQPGRTVTMCQAEGKSSFIVINRKDGRFENVRLDLLMHPPTDASMFIRFVRGTSVGNMGAVGMQLLTEAKKLGNACVIEEAAKVCAGFAAGDFGIEAK
jgi:hypothetical protein